MAKDSPKGKVIDFGSARKNAPSAVEAKAAGNAQPKPFLETWLKNHEDSQSVVQENLSLKEQKRLLEEERRSLIPSLDENLLHYGSLIFAVGALLGLIMLAG